MKRRLRRALDRVSALVGRVLIEVVARRHPGGIVTVLDVDNTIADAWPSFLRSWPGEAARLRALRPLPGMRAAAYEPAPGSVVFLSHRSWWFWPLTRTWLSAAGFEGPVVLVADPAEKVAHLRRLAARHPVVYWDDLTAHQETGHPVRYDEVIEAVGAIDGVEYHGADEIEAIVAAAGGR